MKSSPDQNTSSNQTSSKKRRIFATAALVLIALLYIATLVFAFLDHPLAKNCLIASLFCTIVVPVFIYVYIGITRYFSNKAKDSD